MLYNSPTGSTDPNAAFVGKNTAAGIQGSKIPPGAAEYPQRELVNIIVETNQSPTNSDLAQVMRGIRSGQLWTFTDTGAANAMVITPRTAHVALIKGLPFRIFPAVTSTAAAVTLAVGATLSAPVKRRDGTALAIGDIIAGLPIDVVYDGAVFRVLSPVASEFSNLSSTAAVSLAQTLITNYPSIGPARNLTPFLTAGTYTYTVPANVYWIYVRLVGAGGGGAGANGSSTWAGAGGGAGGYAESWIAVTPGQQFTCVVGLKGAAGANSNQAIGGTGGTTSFGSAMSATGGVGGTGGTSYCAGGSAGVGSGGQINLYGGDGGDGNSFTANAPGGQGGASAFGGGGRTSTIGTGIPDALAPGAGGGGIWGTGSTSYAGGKGADGAIFVSC